MKKWTEQTAIDKLRQNGIPVRGKDIIADTAGLKLLSAIDYLCNHCGYTRYSR